ncbi:MAG: hypothetical protein B6I24_09930 [Bacteroidetes bacterium 4572_128]|nr:MAG: hypothetical protein B6I24_09930 [Bacteroidetes bacterium 4572_128]
METYKFETTVLENGMIQIPDFLKYKTQRVEVFLVLKQKKKLIKKEKNVEDFLDKWFAYFPEIETNDVRYNAIIGKNK